MPVLMRTRLIKLDALWYCHAQLQRERQANIQSLQARQDTPWTQCYTIIGEDASMLNIRDTESIDLSTCTSQVSKHSSKKR